MSTTSQWLGWIEYHRFKLFGLCSKPDIFVCIEKTCAYINIYIYTLKTTNREYWKHVMNSDNIYSSWCVFQNDIYWEEDVSARNSGNFVLVALVGWAYHFFSHISSTTCNCMNSVIARCMTINIWNNTPTFESIQSSLMHCLKGLDVLLEMRAVYLQTYIYT